MYQRVDGVPRLRLVVARLLMVTLVLVAFVPNQRTSFVDADGVDLEVDSVKDYNSGVADINVEDGGQQEEEGNDEDYEEGGGEDYETDGTQDGGDDDEDTAKQGYSYPPAPPQKKKKVFVPVFVPEKEKKKMKIISVEKGFYIQGGTQLFGKFKSLKHCMKACAVDPTCYEGDFNPWLHKCYKHTNITACGKQKSHPQFVHFSKIPCTITDAPRGHISLGVSAPNGIEVKGVENLQQCIKKCVNAGRGIPLSVQAVPATLGSEFSYQACFGIDYDFATHKCYVFGANFVIPGAFTVECSLAATTGSPQTSIANPTVVHITFCPNFAAG